MEPTKLYPIVAVLSLVTVEYGGWALLSFLTVRRQLNDFQTTFFRAGHAHAGVLLVLSLVYFIYLDRTDFGEGTQWLAGALLLAGVLVHPGGLFLHMAVGGEGRASIGTRLTRLGAGLIAAALIFLAVGLIREA